MKRTQRLLSLLLSAALVLALAACGGGTATNTTPATGSGTQSGAADKDTFTVVLDSDIVALDPAFAYDFTTNPVVNQITQGLLIFDDDNQLQPMLASSWEQVDDVTYVYQIRDDVTFSDGTPMTMDDVLFSLERTASEETASYLGWMFDGVSSMEQTGDWELTITLSQPDASFKYYVGTDAFHVISKAYAESVGEKLGTPEGGLVGTGPYKFVSWQNGTEVVLTRNENYWGDDPAYFENLVFKIIGESTTQVTALQTGEVDCSVAPPYDMLEVLKADANLNLQANNGFGVQYIAFNNAKEPFNDVNVRKAIYHAINFQAIQDNLVKEAGTLAGLLPSSEALFTIEPERWTEYAASKPALSYDVDEAKALLAEAGLADGFSCNLYISSTSLANSIGLAIQNDLAQVGITVELIKVSTDEHTAYQFGDILGDDGLRAYDMILAGWEADVPDPAGNLTPLYQGGNSSNAAAYSNAEVDELISQQAQSSDPTERNDLMFQAFDIITEDVPYIFVYYPTKNLVMNKAYTGVTMGAAWSWNMQFQGARPVE